MLIHITTLNSFLSQTSVYSTNLSSFVNGSDIPTASAQKNEKWKSLSGFCVKLYYVLLIHLIIHHLRSLTRTPDMAASHSILNSKKSHTSFFFFVLGKNLPNYAKKSAMYICVKIFLLL